VIPLQAEVVMPWSAIFFEGMRGDIRNLGKVEAEFRW
jgi:hypothetical protein